MPSTKTRKPRRRKKPALRPKKTCTRCGHETRDWYPTTGGAKLPYLRCNVCFEDEVRRMTRDELSYDLARKYERKETLKEFR
jgi:transcription elongation factor Elf1